ncbi:MAG: DegT/DnrJ/EryC1/StrS family aminotransferase [Bacteroidetes bacterium]|nr:DegT/DnrJ/EryC1/StrS family aminotransferase [Bacteroidota bacterium]
MPGFELIGNEEKNNLLDIFETSNGVFFPHGFDKLRNGRFRVREFEKKFSEKMQIRHTQAVTSGTVAQVVAMHALGIQPGDEVITQAFTFVATVETILQIGAVPVIVDVDETFNMDPKELEKVITPKTKLIVPVHMLGNPASMKEIMAIAAKHGIPVLEDSCEALGASYQGKWAGTIGDIGIYSLDFGKTITTGEGGFVVTNNDSYYKFMREYTDHGHENNPALPRGKDTRTMYGMNYRMNEMQGAVGMAQLEKLDFILQKNRENKRILKSRINADKIVFRRITDENGELADTLIFSLENEALAKEFVRKLYEAGYGTKNVPDAIDWHFAGTWNHMFDNVPAYKDSWKHAWSGTAELLNRSVALPIMIHSSEEELQKQADVINQILDSI